MSDATFSTAQSELSRRALLKASAGGVAAALAVTAGAANVSAAPLRQDGASQITIAWGRYPLTFNPIDPVGGIERTVWQLTTSRLINRNAAGEIIPDLAETWDISEDGLVYTFNLAKTAKWTDGTPVTARDVAVTYTFATDKRTGGQGFTPAAAMEIVKGVPEFLAGTAESVSGIVVVDDYTIRFELTQPDASFLSFIAGYSGPYLVPAHVVGEIPADQFDASDYNKVFPRVGMGPYVLTEAVQDQYLIFIRNDTFFKGPAAIESFVYRVMQPDVALAALLKGEVDVASIPAREYPTTIEEDSVQVITYPANLWNGLMFNMTVADLQDPRIHQAVVHALDRETYAKAILNGLGVPWDSIIVQQQWLSPNIVQYEYDPDKARALLAEAGWQEDRVVEWKYYGGFSDLAPVLQQSLAEVGFKINPVALETATWVEDYLAGNFEFSVVGGGGITDDPSELVSYFQCDTWSRYCNQELLDLFPLGRAAVDPAERKSYYDQVQDIVNRDLPWFPLFAVTSAVGMTKRVKPAAYSSYDYLFYEKWTLDG